MFRTTNTRMRKVRCDMELLPICQGDGLATLQNERLGSRFTKRADFWFSKISIGSRKEVKNSEPHRERLKTERSFYDHEEKASKKVES